MSWITPLLQVTEDFMLTVFRDDQKDFAFPGRAHAGFHHYHLPLLWIPLGRIAMELIDVYEIIKKEKFRHTDTPGIFLQRCIAIHRKTYVPPQDQQEDRVAMLHQYLDQLKGERNKQTIEKKIENAIYMGTLKTKTQINAERKKKTMHPRVRSRFSNKIMLYKSGK